MKNLPQKVRSRKLNSRVDLTAMVSVSFLLIIFFMVVGELSKSKVMDLSLPDKDPGCKNFSCGHIKGSRLYTILLDKDDKIITYSGILEYDISTLKKMKFENNVIRKEVFRKKKEVSEYMSSLGKPKSGVIVIIKPSKKSNFKNLIDILDEMAIAKIDTYAIVSDFSPEESKLLASN
ncbi:ExbD/TolR family protein [Flavobacterium tistrianum]|uniref:ExbD/TolR family protein n=1 Tax=Flavobacterium tistrianum TaxID=1685414 RepID=UPI000DAD73A4|nr:biopolymer transporter ExbD [Flavobacterium tistrianum]KAF2338087.1 biopolymer transporter ExbD [Flavobacterium tistrianum]